MEIEEHLNRADSEAIRFDGIDDAIIGTDYNGWLVYDHSKMIDAFMRQGMAADDAIEWIDYNVLSINGGNGFTVIFT